MKEANNILQEESYYLFGLQHSGTKAAQTGTENQYQYNGKEYNTEIGMYDYGARFYMADLGRWGVIDPLAEKYYPVNPYNYVINNPTIFIDPDGRDWFYHSTDGSSDPTWNWHDGSEYNTGVKDDVGNNVILKGSKAVVVFEGSRDEKLGTKNGKEGYIDGEGAITAEVTVYGPKGKDDIHKFVGYTMGSDPQNFGAIDEGTYNGNYDQVGKSGSLKSHWAVENRGKVRMMDGAINPYAPKQVYNGEGYKNGIFIHSSNSNGYAGTISNGTSGISVGCLLIAPKDWNLFNKVMDGVKKFTIQVQRWSVLKRSNDSPDGVVPVYTPEKRYLKKD